MSCCDVVPFFFALPMPSALHLDMVVTTPSHVGEVILVVASKKSVVPLHHHHYHHQGSPLFVLLLHGTHLLAPPCTPFHILANLAMSTIIKLPCALPPLILLWCQFHRHPPSPESIIISRCISFMHLLYFVHA